MTALTITPDTTEAEAIIRARALLERAERFLDTQECECIHRAARRLRDRLEDHGLIESGFLHPASEFEDLGHGHPDDALGVALGRVEAGIADLARELADEVWEHTGEHIGDGAAEYVAGGSE